MSCERGFGRLVCMDCLEIAGVSEDEDEKRCPLWEEKRHFIFKSGLAE